MSKEELLAKLGEIAKKHAVDMAKEMIVELVGPALEEAAKASATPVDDMIVAALEGPMKQALLDLLAKA